MSTPISTPVRGQVKAILAGLTTGVGALATAALDGQIVMVEWLVAAGLAIGAYGAVFGVSQPAPAPVDQP
jgi:hypothetical protein